MTMKIIRAKQNRAHFLELRVQFQRAKAGGETGLIAFRDDLVHRPEGVGYWELFFVARTESELGNEGDCERYVQLFKQLHLELYEADQSGKGQTRGGSG